MTPHPPRCQHLGNLPHMAERKRWDEGKKAEALTIYVQQGAAVASTLTGIPAGTIASWANRDPAIASLRAVKSELTEAAVDARTKTAHLAWADRRARLLEHLGGLADSFAETAHDLLEQGDVKGAKEAALGLAITIDKGQLLSGGATGRTEHEVTNQVRDELVAAGREKVLELLPPSRAKESAG